MLFRSFGNGERVEPCVGKAAGRLKVRPIELVLASDQVGETRECFCQNGLEVEMESGSMRNRKMGKSRIFLEETQ